MRDGQYIHILGIASILFLLSFSAVWADTPGGEAVSISKIRIVIEDKTYTWDDRNSIPEKEGGVTAPSTVISFLSFAPGDILEIHNLENEAMLAEKRLLRSGYFFNAQVIIIPPRKKPESRTILIKVTEGFRYRFSGGNLFAMFGIDNLSGERKNFRIFLGYNLIGGSFMDENLFNRNSTLGVNAYYSNQGLTSLPVVNYHRMDTAIIGGFRPHPDVFLGIDLGARYIGFPESTENNRKDIILSPNFRYILSPGKKDDNNNIKLEGRGNLYWTPEEEGFNASLLVKASAGYEFMEDHSVNIQISGGGAVSSLPDPDKFDLYYTEDLSIRSDQDQTDMLVDQFVLLNFEYRFSISQFFIPPVFNIGIRGFLFTDIGWIAEYDGTLFEDPVKDAYGAGLRLVLDNPVFASFSFSYGINRLGKGRFVITATGGF